MASVVALSHLMVGKRGLVAGAVGHDLIALVEQVLFPEVLEDPPDQLDIFVGVGHVGIFEVHPVGDAIGELAPVADIFEGGLAAFLVELGDAHFLDLMLVGEAVLLLDLDLDREAVGIPAAAARDVEAAHDLVAREHILEGARQYMMDAGATVGGGRALVEDVFGAALRLLDGLLERSARAPRN